MTEAAAARVARATGKALGCRARPRVSKPPMEAAQPGLLIGRWHLVLGTGAGPPTRQRPGVGEAAGGGPATAAALPSCAGPCEPQITASTLPPAPARSAAAQPENPRLFLGRAPQPWAAVPAAGEEGECAEGRRMCWKHPLVAQPRGRRYPRLQPCPPLSQRRAGPRGREWPPAPGWHQDGAWSAKGSV